MVWPTPGTIETVKEQHAQSQRVVYMQMMYKHIVSLATKQRGQGVG